MIEALTKRVRPSAVAGTFYPAQPRELRQTVSSLLAEAKVLDLAPKALIVPHAGYVYSGPIAASGYAQLRSIRDRIRRVVLLGPSHRIPFYGIAATSMDAFETPLGQIPIDPSAVAASLQLPSVQVLDEGHRQEHSLEVQLPFLQWVLSEFVLAPFAIGRIGGQEVADLIELLWGGEETLIVVSSDLSHYHDYRTARSIDRETTRFIENGQWQRLSGERACGFLGIAGLLCAATQRGLSVRTVDLRNSGDTAGGKEEVVGYGCYAIC